MPVKSEANIHLFKSNQRRDERERDASINLSLNGVDEVISVIYLHSFD